MPLEQLMALYGYGDGVKSQQKGENSEEEVLEDALTASSAVKKEEPEIKIGEKRKRDYDDYVSESAGSGTGSESRELANGKLFVFLATCKKIFQDLSRFSVWSN